MFILEFHETLLNKWYNIKVCKYSDAGERDNLKQKAVNIARNRITIEKWDYG